MNGYSESQKTDKNIYQSTKSLIIAHLSSD